VTVVAAIIAIWAGIRVIVRMGRCCIEVLCEATCKDAVGLVVPSREVSRSQSD